jgi:hypothetical protein
MISWAPEHSQQHSNSEAQHSRCAAEDDGGRREHGRPLHLLHDVTPDRPSSDRSRTPARWLSGVSPQAEQTGTHPGILVIVFERLTDRARRVLVLAQEEARTLYHSCIGSEHLLLGLLREGEGIAAKALAGVGVDYVQTRQLVEQGVPQRPPPGSPPFSAGAKRILERSLRLSMTRGDSDIGTEHLLLGLLDQHDAATTGIFTALGVPEQEIEGRVEFLLAERRAPANPVIASRLPSAVALVTTSDPAQRLEVLEGLLWGIDHLHDVLAATRGSENRLEARDALMAPPFSLSWDQVTGVLDLSVDSVTADRRRQLVQEIELLRRHVLDDGT